MRGVDTPKAIEAERPKRPEQQESSNDKPFESDVFGALPDIPIGEQPKPRPTPKPARRAKLTEELVSGLQPEAKQFYCWDTKLKGLGVRVGATGSVTYVLKLSLPGKRSVWKTLEAPTLSLAVVEYHDLLAKHGRGDALPARQVEILWQDAVDRFKKEKLGSVKATTAASYTSALILVREAFINRPIRMLEYEDVKAFHAGLVDRPRQANVCINLCKMIFDRAEAWRFRDQRSNPVELLRKSGWKPYPEEKRDVRLSADQLHQIGIALASMEAEGKESVFTIATVRLLLFTGKRLREILDLKWSDVNPEGRLIKLEDHKTFGKVGILKSPLNDEALKVIQSLPRLKYINEDGLEVEHPYILPGRAPGKPIQDLRRFWTRLIKLAGLNKILKEKTDEETNLRRHDLRHAHGNESADQDLNLQTIAALLGHADANSSARYSKAGQNPALAASQKVSGSLSSKLRGGGDS